MEPEGELNRCFRRVQAVFGATGLEVVETNGATTEIVRRIESCAAAIPEGQKAGVTRHVSKPDRLV